MKALAIIFITFFSVYGFTCEGDEKNLDRIGTFLGVDDPFPWGREARLPSDLGGVWEVRETEDGAYFVIEQSKNPVSGKEDIKINLFDPCTFDLNAEGEGFILNNTFYSTLSYFHQKMNVKLKIKAFYKGQRQQQQSEEDIQLVIMVMSPSDDKKLNKYFPISKIGVLEVASKCDVPNLQGR